MTEKNKRFKKAANAVITAIVDGVMVQLATLLDGDGLNITIRRARPEDTLDNKSHAIVKNQQDTDEQWKLVTKDKQDYIDV